MKIITLCCLLSERWYCLKGFLSNFDNIDYDKSLINLRLFTNTENEKFNQIVLNEANKHNWKSIKIIHTNDPVVECDEHNITFTNDLRFSYAVKAMNMMNKEALNTDCDYMWFLEDDCAVPPNFLTKGLSDFTDKVGIVGAYFEQRWNTIELKRYPLVWKYYKKYTFGETDTSGEVQISCLSINPSQDKWIQEVDGISTGSILIRKEILDKFEWHFELQGIKYQDCAMGLEIQPLGYTILCDWSLKGKHIHKTGDLLY